MNMSVLNQKQVEELLNSLLHLHPSVRLVSVMENPEAKGTLAAYVSMKCSRCRRDAVVRLQASIPDGGQSPWLVAINATLAERAGRWDGCTRLDPYPIAVRFADGSIVTRPAIQGCHAERAGFAVDRDDGTFEMFTIKRTEEKDADGRPIYEAWKEARA